jgi:hypothetical protein
VIQEPGNPQNWNGYSYVFNNPYAYTDPTGMMGQKERQWLAIAVAIVAAIFQQYYISANMYAAAFAVTVAGGFASGAIATQSFKGGLYGAFGAALTFGVGYATMGWNPSGQIAAQAMTGGVIEYLQGGNFGHGFASAGLSATIMPGIMRIGRPLARIVVAAIAGGTISAITGGKFASGAVSGALQAAMAGGDQSDSVSTEQQNASASQGAIATPVFYDSSGNPISAHASLADALQSGKVAALQAKAASGTNNEYGVATILGLSIPSMQMPFGISPPPLQLYYNSAPVTSNLPDKIMWRLGGIKDLVALNHSHPNSLGFSAADRTAYTSIRRSQKNFQGIYMFDSAGNHWYGPKSPGFFGTRTHRCGGASASAWTCASVGPGWTP